MPTRPQDGGGADTTPVFDTIRTSRERLSPAERKVAGIILDDPEAVAFGTVADLAARSSTSGPTVIRLAQRLGFEGYRELQQAVRHELGRQLRPAARRIRSTAPGDSVARTLTVELENLTASLESITPAQLDEAARLLTDPKRAVFVLPSEQTRAVGALLAAELATLRDDVTLLFGTEFRVASLLATLEPRDVVVPIDLRRYERWLLRTRTWAVERGAVVIAITDSALSPLADDGLTFVARAEAAGPFDSQIGMHAIVNALVTDVARRLRGRATKRLDRLEQHWLDTDVFEP